LRSAAAPLLDREAAVWRHELGWEVRQAWAGIEPGRAAGCLPGLLVVDDAGRPQGWACYLRHGDMLQVAMLVADKPETTEALLAGILQSDPARAARGCAVFVRDAAPGLAAALVRAGFDVGTYRYRSRPLESPPGPVVMDARAWQASDVLPMSRLCGRAYHEAIDVRAFAPDGTAAQWLDYVRTLVNGAGCGSLLPVASLVVPGRAGGFEAGILTTDLGPGTAHIAQVVVDPDARGRGLGRALVTSAMARSAALGFGRITLLVADTNRAARGLYDSLGFETAHAFIAATRQGLKKPTQVPRP
jgi:GNAT superfamily N-acetyltransferase